MTESSTVICDAGPLIHLDELNKLQLLSDFSNLLTTDIVWQEVIQHRSINLTSLLIEQLIAPPPDYQLETLAKTLCLHIGEVSVLSLATTQSNVLFLTDDSAARLAASQMQFKVHGTIGILLRSVRRGLTSALDIKQCLESIPQRSTLHIRLDILKQAITELEKYQKLHF